MSIWRCLAASPILPHCRRCSSTAREVYGLTGIALDRIKPIHESFVELLEQRYDTILTPAAPGAAPIEKKGSGVFSRQSNPDCYVRPQSNPTIGTPEHRCGSLTSCSRRLTSPRSAREQIIERRAALVRSPPRDITLLVVTHLVEKDPGYWRPVQRGRILDHHAVASQVVPDAQYHHRVGVGARDNHAVAL